MAHRRNRRRKKGRFKNSKIKARPDHRTHSDTELRTSTASEDGTKKEEEEYPIQQSTSPTSLVLANTLGTNADVKKH